MNRRELYKEKLESYAIWRAWTQVGGTILPSRRDVCAWLHPTAEDFDVEECYVRDCGVVPDLWVLKDGKLIAIEIEDTSPITFEKLIKYEQLWFYLDCDSLWFRLICFDRYGEKSTEIDLEHASSFFGARHSPNPEIYLYGDNVKRSKRKAVKHETGEECGDDG